jgi:mannose/fructose/N-acetylgalactosamine-specific phosphotransferase system component IIC
VITWIALATLGGLVGLDATSFPQMMFSRPLVAGALTGAILGRPFEGILVGAILEVFDVAILPIGASRYPEPGPAAVSAAAAYIAASPASAAPGMLLLAVVFGLAWDRIAGASVVLSRQANEKVLRDPATGDDRQVERRQLAAMGIDFARGAAVTVIGAAAGSALLRAIGPLWTVNATITRGVLLLGATVVLGGALTIFGGWAERKNVFLFGVICGSLALLLLR